MSSRQWRRQNFAPGGGTGAWRTGFEFRGDKVIQKWKPSGVRSVKFASVDKIHLGVSQMQTIENCSFSPLVVPA